GEVLIVRGDTRRIVRTREGEMTRVHLSIPDSKISAVHARVAVDLEGAFVEDLGSTNGTLVDGVPAGRLPLHSGSLIELGRSLFLYREIVERKALRVPDLDGEREAGDASGLGTLDPIHAEPVDRLRRIVPSPVTVMLLGETGTGKEITARAVHALSK